MATVIRVNPAASPLRNVSFTGLASVAVGDRVPVRIELVSDARSGAAGYTPALYLGVRGTPLASVASWTSSTIGGVAGWDGILRCDTSELADYVGLNASMTVQCQIIVEKNDTSELVTEAQNQVTVFSTVAPDGVFIPTPDTPTYAELIALESSAVAANSSAVASASSASGSASAALASSISASGSASSALASAVSASASASSALSSAIVAQSAASAAVAVVPSISAALLLKVSKDASGNAEALNSLRAAVSPTVLPHAEGTMQWSAEDHTLELHTEISGVKLQVGQENFVRVRNMTGSPLLNGRAVYINGSTGTRPTCAYADNTVSASSQKTIGVLTADIANAADGYCTTSGLVRDINTSAFSDGAVAYLGTAGQLLTAPPAAPYEVIRIGHIVRAHVTQGVLLVHVQHNQDAGEVEFVPTDGITATNVQSAIAQEANLRISSTSALSAAISAETSTRAANDSVLSSAIVTEASTARSAESTLSAAVALRAPIANSTLTGTTSVQTLSVTGATTLTGALNANGGILAGTGTAKAWAGSYPTDVNTTCSWAHSAFSASTTGYALAQSSGGITNLNSESGQELRLKQGNLIRALINADGTWTFNTAATFSTITNYAADVPVATLLALTPAQSALKRKATVTGAYRMDGTIGRVPAEYDGDSSAGVWVIGGTTIPITADFYTFASAYALAQAPEKQAVYWPSVGSKFYSERFMIRGDVDSASYVADAAGTGGAVTSTQGGGGYRYLSLTLGTSSGALTRTKSGMPLPRWLAGTTGASAFMSSEFVVSHDFAAEGAGLMVCMHQPDSNWASNASAVSGGVIICDPNDVFGYGASSVMRAFCGGASGFSTSDGAAVSIGTQYRLTILRTPTVLRVYMNGVQVGNDISTNLQTMNDRYHLRVVMLRPNSAGTNTRLFRLQNATTVQITP